MQRVRENNGIIFIGRQDVYFIQQRDGGKFHSVYRQISIKKSRLQFIAAEMKLTSDELIHQKEQCAYFDNKK